MSDNLSDRSRWHQSVRPGSSSVRFAQRMGWSNNRARQRKPEVMREAEVLVESMVAADEVAEAAAFVARLSAKLEAFTPGVASAAAAEAQADSHEDVAQVTYHLAPSDKTARSLMDRLGAVLVRTEQFIGALRAAHPEA